MNKLITKIVGVALGLGLATGVGAGVVAGNKSIEPAYASSTATWAAANMGLTNGEATIDDVFEFDDDSNVTISFTDGGTPTAYYTNGGVRIYNGGTFIISSSSGNITNITLSYSLNSGATISADPSGGFSSGDTTWSGNASTVTFTAGTIKHVRLATLSVTYTSGGGEQTSYTGVTISEKTPLTGRYKGYAYYECNASVSGTGSYSSTVTWSITSTNTYGTGTSITNVASIDVNGKITFLDNVNAIYVWATAADEATHNATGFSVSASGLLGNPIPDWTLITDDADVSINTIFALSNNKTNFGASAVSSQKIALTTSLPDIGYFALEPATGGYYLRFATYNNNDSVWEANGSYVNYSGSSTNLSSGNAGSTVWVLEENGQNGVFLRISGGRHLGINGTSEIKAYANQNIGTNLPVYLYEVGSLPTIECNTIELTGKPTNDMSIGDTATLGYSALAGNGDDWVGDVIYSISNESTSGVVELSATSGLTVTLTAKKAGTARVSVQDQAQKAEADYVDVTVLEDPERVNLPVGNYSVTLSISGSGTVIGNTSSHEIKAKEGTGENRIWYKNLVLNYVGVTNSYSNEFTMAKSTGVISTNNTSNATITSVEIDYFGYENATMYVAGQSVSSTSGTNSSNESSLMKIYSINAANFSLENKDDAHAQSFYSMKINLTVVDENEEFLSLVINKGTTATSFTEGDVPNATGLTVHENYSTDGSTISRYVDVTSSVTWTYSIETIAANTTSYTVTATYGGHTSEAVTIDGFTVTAISKYSHVTSQDDLYDGAVVILAVVGNNNKTAASFHNSNYFTVQDANLVNGKVQSNDEMEFVVRMFGDKFSLERNGSFLNYYGSSNNVYLTSETLNASAAKCGWMLDSTGLLSNVEGRYLRYNSSSPRFACYTNASYQTVQLYMSDSSTLNTTNKANTFLYRELHLRDISTSNRTEGTACQGNNGYYAKAKAVFTSESFADARATVLANADAVERLQAWALANGETFNASTGTFTANPNTAKLFVSITDNSAVMTFVIVAIVLTTTTGAIFLLRKKKEER